MHSDFPEKPMLPLGDKVGYYMQNPPMASVFFNGFVPAGIKPIMPFPNVDIQPSNACPRNYIIFDQTNNRSQIMFHPEISSKLFYPGFGVETPDNVVQKDINDDRKISSPLEEEDSDDIDALLSTEHEENEECDDDEVVSTARTDAIYECSSPDSCSNYESVSKKRRPLFGKSGGNEKKHRRMRKMVKALRGIVPGANRMSTVAVLDETVRYLKSIRVEVQKLGVGNFKG
ncbi:hypothetical protein DH2020_032708 [Rehmannia glutinosa]|uniref:BHLH domain-containing protein n=1 Tax=Rehmannia glutinosa TaxID=99300 RepID=A0ABR0VH84_REHGL